MVESTTTLEDLLLIIDHNYYDIESIGVVRDDSTLYVNLYVLSDDYTTIARNKYTYCYHNMCFQSICFIIECIMIAMNDTMEITEQE